MTLPKDCEQLFVGNDLGIEVDLDGFGVITDESIGRVFGLPTCIADASTKNTGEAPKLGVGAPESAKGKGCGFAVFGIGRGFPKRGSCCRHF